MGKGKLNPELMIGDEIMVVSTEGIHDFGIPELFKPYVVVGIKHRQRENWQGPDTDTTYYQIEPLDITDEQRTGAMLAGGGRARPMYIFPKDSSQQHFGNYMKEADQWILRPGFLRGELEEEGETNEAARTLSKARKAGVDTYYPKSAVKANPERFRKYTRDKYLNEYNQPGLNPELKVDDIVRVIDVDGEHKNMPERFKIYKVVNVSAYDKNNFIYDLIPPDLDLEKVSTFDSRGVPIFHSKNLYRGDTWIKIDSTIKEQEQPGLSPELTYGDTILVVDVDRERENSKTTYNTPSEEMRPETYKPYTVVDKESNGHKSKWPFRYTLVPEDKLEEYEESLDKGWGNYEGYEKLLYPWIYEWIFANTPKANKVDRLTINEHGADTSWADDDDKVTLQDILELTKDIPIINYPTKELAKLPSLKKLVLGWDPEEIERISQVDVSRQYPILIMVNEYNEVQWILDGNHRAQQAVMNDIPTIPAKLIKPSDLDERSIKIFYPYGIPDKENLNKMEESLKEQKQEFNQPLTMGDIIRVVDVDKESTYEQPKYPYDTGNDTGNSLTTNHHRGQIHGQDTYPRPMVVYAVMSKSMYRPLDRDHLNPYWMLWPVGENYKIQSNVFKFREIILTEKDTWMTLKKHISNIPGDIEAKQKEYDDSGRNITSRRLDEQVEPEEFGIIDGDDKDNFSDEEKREIDAEYVDTTPFKPMEVKILKTLHKHLDRSELQKLSLETPENYGGLDGKFWDIMKLFGISVGTTEENTRTSKYAKWASDNWNEEGNYNIEDPIKVPLKWYGVEREESGSQVEYKSGDAEVLGFDEDDAGDRADSDFYSWGGEMETHDYGDYETYDTEITNTEFIRMDESITSKLGGVEIEDLLFNFWRKVGPTLDPNKLKLIGFNMDDYDERSLVWDNLREYYGNEELTAIIEDRLEGLHDSWSYEYIVTSFEPIEEGNSEIIVNILVNGDTQIPISQESGGAIDMSLWDINEKSAEDDYSDDDVYEEARSTISDDISSVLLKDLPVDMSLDYMDISEPGTFENYVKENEVQVITEEDDGYIDDMVYIDEPRDKHIKRMDRGLGSLVGFPLDKWKNMPPPQNESDTTEEEIEYLEDIPVDKKLVDSADEIVKHFTKFLTTKKLEYPKQELKEIMVGVKSIILILKYHYNRPRPWQIAKAKGLELNSETLQSSSSPSYPSGHATQGRFVARYLSDLYPEHSEELMQIGEDIAYSRNMAKVHYPTDSTFGKLLGDEMYDFISNDTINEQVVVDKGDRLKSDIFRILSNTFILTPIDYSEIKDTDGNYYGIYDIKEEAYVNMSDLIEGVLDFISFGVESGDFKEEDIEKGITAITSWISLMMNQKKDLVN